MNVLRASSLHKCPSMVWRVPFECEVQRKDQRALLVATRDDLGEQVWRMTRRLGCRSPGVAVENGGHRSTSGKRYWTPPTRLVSTNQTRLGPSVLQLAALDRSQAGGLRSPHHPASFACVSRMIQLQNAGKPPSTGSTSTAGTS